jgi:hypothetical protein
MPERLVRRTLRLVARRRIQHHHKRLVLWALAILPQIPLAITPLPNGPVYYTIYRLIAHNGDRPPACLPQACLRCLHACVPARLLARSPASALSCALSCAPRGRLARLSTMWLCGCCRCQGRRRGCQCHV